MNTPDLTRGPDFRRIFNGLLVAVVFTLSQQLPAHAVINPVNVTNINFGTATYSVAVSGHYAYVTTGSGMRVLDISNPINPLQVGLEDVGTLMVASDNHLYLLNLGNAVLSVLDISTPSNPVLVGQMQLTNCCYCNLSVSDRYAYATSSAAWTGGVTICDVSDPTNPVQAGEITMPALHSPYGFAIAGRYGYMPVNGYGLYAWDISDPTNPRNVGEGAVMNYAYDVAISGNYAYVTASTNALQVFDISNPTNPVNLHVYPQTIPAYDISVAVSGNYAYAFDGPSFAALDISNPTNSNVVYAYGSAWQNNSSLITKMAIAGNFVYLPAGNGEGISIWSLGIPAPQLAINSTNGTVILAWPTPTGAFSIQQSPGLNPPAWVTLTNAPIVVGSENQVTLPSPPGNTFYRLILQ